MPREKKGEIVAIAPKKRGRPPKIAVKPTRGRPKKVIPEPVVYGTSPVAGHSAAPGFSITVQIPPLRRPKNTTNDGSQQTRKRFLRPIILVPILLLIGGVVLVSPRATSNKKPTIQAAAAERTEPEYKVLVPSAEQASAPRYDGKRNIVSYETTFSSARVTVSQQTLPKTFATDPVAIMRAADSIKATDHVETVKGTIYIATHEDAGDQLAVFASKEVLVFIHTDKKMDSTSWKSFVELLTQKPWNDVKTQGTVQ